MYLTRTPRIIRKLYADAIWNVGVEDKILFLTFDDGPIPEVTPWVLDLLKSYRAKATFFCVGENILKYPDIFCKVEADGHLIGNHTQHHLRGLSTDNVTYLKNIQLCEDSILQHSKQPATIRLFRPPYGQIKRSQYRSLHRMKHPSGGSYQMVMWDVLSGDFDQKTYPEECFQHVIRSAKKGSIPVFHDSIKAFPNLKETLPMVLEHYTNEGFRFESLPVEV